MIFLLIVVSGVVSQIKPVGPINAYMANFADIKARLRYEYAHGFTGPEAIEVVRAWDGREVAFVEDPEDTLIGEWSCDGSTQDMLCYLKNSVKEMGGASQRGASGSPAAPKVRDPSRVGIEVIWDDVDQAEHQLGENVINVFHRGKPGLANQGRGPTCWWGTFRFPDTITHESETCNLPYHRASVGGHGTVVEIYQKDFSPGTWGRYEIYYDPNIGYWPRYMRCYAEANRSAECRELYTIEARPCSSGGFAPVQWYEVVYSCQPVRYRAATDLIEAPRPTGKVAIGRAKVSEFDDLKGDAAMNQVEPARSIATMGGSVLLSSSAPLTLRRIKDSLGRRLTEARPTHVPTLDADEMEQFQAPRRTGGWVWQVVIAAVSLLGCLLLWRYKRGRSGAVMSVSLALGCASGCSGPADTSPRLTAKFDRSYVLFDVQGSSIPLALDVRNEGNAPIKLFKIDGGCVCRQVDLTGFPVTLKPGEGRTVSVTLTSAPRAEQEAYRFKFESDRGTIERIASIVLLARHSFYPETVSIPALGEKQDWSFDVTHRAILEAGKSPPSSDLRGSGEFVIRKESTKRGKVSVEPKLEYFDTNFIVTLSDFDRGLHKSALVLDESGKVAPLELPVVWQRVAHLSTVPERAVLGTKSVRLFLRCPDQTVEFTKVLSAPRGIRASIAAPRELSISLQNDAPPVIDDIVTVGTTDEAHGSVKVPVVRFSVQ